MASATHDTSGNVYHVPAQIAYSPPSIDSRRTVTSSCHLILFPFFHRGSGMAVC